MNPNYLDTIDALLVRHGNTDYFEDAEHRNRFALFSAALYHVIPDIPFSGHTDLYREYVYQRQWSALDLSFLVKNDPFAVEGWVDILTDLQRSAPSIIGSFHYGSYRLLPYLLQKHRIPFCMLIRRDVREEQEAYYAYLLKTQDSPQPLFDIVDADDPLAALKVRRMLRDGYHVLSYFDGIEAIRMEQAADNCVAVRDARFRVREGLPYLAARFGVDLKAILVTNADSTQRVLYGGTWTATQVRALGAMPAMQEVYDWFADRMLRDPMAWENWGELHRFLYITGTRSHDVSFGFDPEQHGLLAFDTSYFVLDKQTLKSYKIDEKVFQAADRHWLGTSAVDS